MVHGSAVESHVEDVYGRGGIEGGKVANIAAYQPLDGGVGYPVGYVACGVCVCEKCGVACGSGVRRLTGWHKEYSKLTKNEMKELW